MRLLDRVLLCAILAVVSVIVLWKLHKRSVAELSVPGASTATSVGLSQTAPVAVTTPDLRSAAATQPDADCMDQEWCSVPMPETSLFRFSPPDDPARWRRAQIMAASGEQVLLKRVIPHFPNYLDFLDGDTLFRRYNLVADYFLDRNNGFSGLVAGGAAAPTSGAKRHVYEWERNAQGPVLPPVYDFRATGRAPIVKLGYVAFAKMKGSAHFTGPSIGEAVIERKPMLEMWRQVRDRIDTPFVALHAANENWGMTGTLFPNRTANWGSCCAADAELNADCRLLTEFLDHDKTLLLLVNQHHNVTHPKLLAAPRGLPLTFPNNAQIVWDSMRALLPRKKSQFVFLSSSTWGYRPKIVECLHRKFAAADFSGASYGTSLRGRLSQEDYYARMGTSRFGVALPGLGYDTFRLWELLTVGSIPVIEKGVGLDKSLWRLPALLVEDFDELTPALLRTAYVEAMYYADEFEFERLRQSWWWSLLMNVSSTRSTGPLLDKFPLAAEDPGFTRPLQRFSCEGGCGDGTKRTPKSYC